MKQPDSIEIKICDGLFVKSMLIHEKYTIVPQHSHHTSHLSMVATGSVRVWKDDELLGDFHAPVGILIEAHTMHKFLSLEDSTLIYCIHATNNADDLVYEENSLSELDFAILKGFQ